MGVGAHGRAGVGRFEGVWWERARAARMLRSAGRSQGTGGTGARNGLGGRVLVGRGHHTGCGVVFLRFTFPSDSHVIVFRNNACSVRSFFLSLRVLSCQHFVRRFVTEDFVSSDRLRAVGTAEIQCLIHGLARYES